MIVRREIFPRFGVPVSLVSDFLHHVNRSFAHHLFLTGVYSKSARNSANPPQTCPHLLAFPRNVHLVFEALQTHLVMCPRCCQERLVVARCRADVQRVDAFGHSECDYFKCGLIQDNITHPFRGLKERPDERCSLQDRMPTQTFEEQLQTAIELSEIPLRMTEVPSPTLACVVRGTLD